MNHTKYDKEAQGQYWEDARAEEARDWGKIVLAIGFCVVSFIVLDGIKDEVISWGLM
jgi:hypothetical protein